MKRERMSLSEVTDIGDRIIVDHMKRCKDANADPASKPMLWKTIETVEDYMPDDALPVELRAVTTYVSAALGHERKRRRRMLVWWDKKAKCPRFRPGPWIGEATGSPPLEEMLTFTVEDAEREHAA